MTGGMPQVIVVRYRRLQRLSRSVVASRALLQLLTSPPDNFPVIQNIVAERVPSLLRDTLPVHELSCHTSFWI